jgi:transketolase
MGHACMLLYGLLHISAVKEVDRETNRPLASGELAVPLDAIKSFRQLGSKCTGHPEYRETTGVEMTTGPLGQGLASSVGMAIASRWLGATFNKPDITLFDFNTYALGGDGCLMEGVTAEAASLAGRLKLSNLCWIWDNNEITIEGNTHWTTSEDIASRFIAYEWNVNRVGDANNVETLQRAFEQFKRENERPTLIIVDSHIAWGSPEMQDSFKAHGTPFTEEEVFNAKDIYEWPPAGYSDEKFLVPDYVAEHLQQQMRDRGGKSRKEWEAKFASYKAKYPDDAKVIRHILEGTLPEGWQKCLPSFPSNPKGVPTRKSSGQILNKLAKEIPWMVGGSADLGTSCLTILDHGDGKPGHFMPASTGWGSYSGRNIHYGIREHAMGAINNGIALCNLRPFGSTFLVFSDYMKPPIRLSAFMQMPCIWIFTHDSIGVGEDGPTHQPIEQLAALRAVPDLLTFRPCDANEVVEMWRHVVKLLDEPAALVLSRQDLPTLDREKYKSAEGLHRGAYIIAGDENQLPELILMAAGSEVHLMLAAHEAFVAKGTKVRSISIPCFELFKMQPESYIRSLLPDACRKRISIETGRREQWAALVGLDGEHIGMYSFGASGKSDHVFESKGFTLANVLEVGKRVLEGTSQSMPSRSEVTLGGLKRRRVSAA